MDLLLNTHNFRLFRVLFSLAEARHALLLLSLSSLSLSLSLSRHIFFLLCDTFIYIYITACARLSRRNGDFALRRRQITSLQFICRQQRPASRLPHAIQSHRDVDDDFTFGRLLRFFVLLDVRSAGVADPAGGVQKADTRNGKLTQVFQVTVDDQVRQTVSAAEQTSFAVVLEARVGFVDGRLQSQRRSGFRVVFLHALCETFDFLLVVLLEGFVCLARRQTGVWLHVSGKRGVDRHRGRDDGGGDERGGFLRRVVSAARDGDIRLLGGRLLRLQVRGRGDLQSLSFALKKKRKVRVSDFLSSRRSKVVQSVRDARARIEIRDDAMRDIREEMAILNHARSSQSRVSSFAWPDFGPRAVRFQAARVRLTDPPARAAFFFRSSDVVFKADTTKRISHHHLSTIIVLPERDISSSHTEDDDGNTTTNQFTRRRKKDTTSRPRGSLRPHATETRPKRDVPCVRAKTWDVFLERICEECARARVVFDILLLFIQRVYDLDSEI